MDTSSADTGSSSTSNFGSTANARAIPIRWHWPPLNSCGKRETASTGSPTSSSSSSTRWRRSFFRYQVVDTQWFANELADGVARVEGRDRVLEDDLHVPA